MGQWSNKPVVLKPIEFDGDSIVFSVGRLLVEDMMTLAKFHNASNGTLSFGSPLEVCAMAQAILPKYVKSISGLRKDDGGEMTVAEFIEASKEFYFVPLIGTLFAELITVSTVQAQAKNSAPPSAE